MEHFVNPEVLTENLVYFVKDCLKPRNQSNVCLEQNKQGVLLKFENLRSVSS